MNPKAKGGFGSKGGFVNAISVFSLNLLGRTIRGIIGRYEKLYVNVGLFGCVIVTWTQHDLPQNISTCLSNIFVVAFFIPSVFTTGNLAVHTWLFSLGFRILLCKCIK